MMLSTAKFQGQAFIKFESPLKNAKKENGTVTDKMREGRTKPVMKLIRLIRTKRIKKPTKDMPCSDKVDGISKCFQDYLQDKLGCKLPWSLGTENSMRKCDQNKDVARYDHCP